MRKQLRKALRRTLRKKPSLVAAALSTQACSPRFRIRLPRILIKSQLLTAAATNLMATTSFGSDFWLRSITTTLGLPLCSVTWSMRRKWRLQGKYRCMRGINDAWFQVAVWGSMRVVLEGAIRLALLNQNLVRLYIGLCVFERFGSISILQILQILRQGHIRIRLSHGPIIPQPQYQIASKQTPSLAMILGYFRAIIDGCIDVVDFGHEGMAFSCFCGHLLRISPLVQPYGSPMAWRTHISSCRGYFHYSFYIE